MKLASSVSAVVLLALALAGCGGGSEEQTAADPAALEQSTWLLSDGIEVAGWQRVTPSVEFSGSRVGGSNGCNSFSGTYEARGSSLRVGRLSSTLMGCEPPGAEVEQAFMEGLEGALEWRLEGGELVLEGGERELRFRVASPEGAWRATSLLQGDAVTTPVEGSEITATLAKGAISGSSGCNDYGGRFRTKGRAISIGGLSVTEMACESPPGVMEQEQAYLEALPRAADFKIEAGGLVLLTQKGTIVATFEPRR